ncbi:hypothetical protein PVAP13_7KG200900 [Panicum virgatum]|uniref:Uncharacterized protein n=1 Tax=Panicum virgatum TaxID=38727 RepID=A0A8T0QN81_PANVG|nr:hypothetical protein PVAP13_7KG200900 [Panicum virgatum]
MASGGEGGGISRGARVQGGGRKAGVCLARTRRQEEAGRRRRRGYVTEGSAQRCDPLSPADLRGPIPPTAKLAVDTPKQSAAAAAARRRTAGHSVDPVAAALPTPNRREASVPPPPKEQDRRRKVGAGWRMWPDGGRLTEGRGQERDGAADAKREGTAASDAGSRGLERGMRRGRPAQWRKAGGGGGIWAHGASAADAINGGGRASQRKEKERGRKPAAPWDAGASAGPTAGRRSGPNLHAARSRRRRRVGRQAAPNPASPGSRPADSSIRGPAACRRRLLPAAAGRRAAATPVGDA